MPIKKFRLVKLLDQLEEVKESYKILKSNCREIKTKKRVFKFLKAKRSNLHKQDEKYFKKCKEVLGETSKEECIKEMKKKIKEMKRKDICLN